MLNGAACSISYTRVCALLLGHAGWNAQQSCANLWHEFAGIDRKVELPNQHKLSPTWATQPVPSPGW